ncbi:MAG: helix-turn-helix transcriptional regulator [Muribaculaceae bacterium]|nr:helix-turn-helix transcriptional regulator [Muribaculaceae bacterium]
MYIGQIIKTVIKEKGISIVSLAKDLSYTRANIYKILDKKSIDTDVLLKISIILEYDFFELYQHEIKKKSNRETK